MSAVPHDIPQKSIDEVQQELVANFNFLENWNDKYAYLIELGKKLKGFPEQCMTEDYKVHGCQSQVWIRVEEDDGRLFMQAASDSTIVSGLVSVLLKVYSGRTPKEILSAPLDFIADMGLSKHLSPNRSTGLYHMIKRIQGEAEAVAQRQV